MSKKRILLIIAICLIAVGVAVCIYIAIRTSPELGDDEFESLRDQLKVYDTEAPTEPPTESPTALPEESGTDDMDDAAESESESETEVETLPTGDPILDFASMQEVNPDIYAWIEIEGTKVDYPILQSPTNDSKYLTTAHDGSWYIGGSLFTQATYNSKDFNDPVTIIYGHTMPSGILFGQLQSVYSSSASFKEHSEIKISLDGEVRRYTVFAAVPFDKYHILHVYDFSNDYWYRNFFKNVAKIHDFSANFNYDAFPEPGDRVIILSTCMNEDSTRRYLVMAILQDDLD